MGMSESGVKKLLSKAGIRVPYPEDAVEQLTVFRAYIRQKQKEAIIAGHKTDVARKNMSHKHDGKTKTTQPKKQPPKWNWTPMTEENISNIRENQWLIKSPKDRASIVEKFRGTMSKKTPEELTAIVEKFRGTMSKKTPEFWSERARKAALHHYVIDGIGFDSKPEAAFYLWHKLNGYNIKRGPVLEFDSEGVKRHYVIDFEIDGELYEVKGKHLMNDLGIWQLPYSDVTEDKQTVTANKWLCAVKNNVHLIEDTTFFEDAIAINYGANFIDLFDVNLPFPEPDRDIYKAHRKGQLSPFEAWTVMPLRQKVIFNRLQYGPFGRKEKDNYSDGRFTPKHPMIYPKDLLNGFTIAKVAPKVSEFKPSRAIDLITKYAPEAKTVIDPFAGWGGRAEACTRMGLTYKGYDINTYREHQGYNIEHKDILTVQDNNHYDCLLTCCPYENIEQYGIETVFKSCDDWTDEILKRFPNVDRYILVVDNKSNKYDKYVVEGITNDCHFKTSLNMEKVIVL